MEKLLCYQYGLRDETPPLLSVQFHPNLVQTLFTEVRKKNDERKKLKYLHLNMFIKQNIL